MLPAKYQFLLQFTDGTYLTVTVQMWGSLQLMTEPEVLADKHLGPRRVSPISAEFSVDFFDTLFEALDRDDPRSIKYFLISQPGVWGLGNGYLQDILFQARLHPRHKAAELTKRERHALHKATQETLRQAVELGGRTRNTTCTTSQAAITASSTPGRWACRAAAAARRFKRPPTWAAWFTSARNAEPSIYDF